MVQHMAVQYLAHVWFTLYLIRLKMKMPICWRRRYSMFLIWVIISCYVHDEIAAEIPKDGNEENVLNDMCVAMAHFLHLNNHLVENQENV